MKTTAAFAMTKDKNIITILKGFAIVLVVIGHAVQTTTNSDFNNLAFRLIYSFHMPLFMFLSGYVTVYSPTNSTEKFKKRFFRLALPFLAWALVSFIIQCVQQKNIDFSYWINLCKNVDNGLWFLWVLFLLHVLFYISEKLKIYGGKYSLLVILLLVQGIPGSFFGLWLMKTYMVFFVLGYYANSAPVVSFLNKKKYFIAAFSLLFFLLLFPFWTFEGNVNFLHTESHSVLVVANKIYKIAIALFAISFVYSLFNIRIVFEKALTFMGRNTLEIYSGHYYFLGPALLMSPFCIANSVVQTILSAVLALTGALLISLILKKSEMLGLIFYGIPIKK